jgi:hypothetical protein
VDVIAPGHRLQAGGKVLFFIAGEDENGDHPRHSIVAVSWRAKLARNADKPKGTAPLDHWA